MSGLSFSVHIATVDGIEISATAHDLMGVAHPSVCTYGVHSYYPTSWGLPETKVLIEELGRAAREVGETSELAAVLLIASVKARELAEQLNLELAKDAGAPSRTDKEN